MKLLKEYHKGSLQTSVNMSFGDAYMVLEEEFILMLIRKKKVEHVNVFIKNQVPYGDEDEDHQYVHRIGEQKYVNGMKEALLFIKTLFSPTDYIEIQKRIMAQL